MNPLIYEKTRDGEVFFDIYARLAKERVIFLPEDVSEESAGIITSMMFLMDKESEDHEPIDFWINSSGGEVESLFAIYDMMQFIKSPVRTFCVGKAYSAAAVLLSAGTPGQRCCTPNSRIMIHQVQAAGLEGSNADIQTDSREIKKTNDRLTEIMARHTGNYLHTVKKDIQRDFYLDPEAALKYGIIDQILRPSKVIPELKKRGRKVGTE